MKKVAVSLLLIIISINLFSQQEIIDSNNKFSFDIYKKLTNTQENLIFSPASITSAMAMTYIGSKNNTFEQISNTFYFNTDITTFCKNYQHLVYFDKDKSSLELYNANSIWLQNGLGLKNEFIELNKKYFNSSLFEVDFIHHPEKSRLNINQWVEKATNNKINKLIAPSAIDNSTRLVLVNALYFKGSWKSKFNKDRNTKGDFQVGKKEYVQSEYMNRAINTFYYSNKYAQMFEIPYTNNKVSLLIILPKSIKKIRKLEKTLNNELFHEYLNNKTRKRISLSIPKFDIESEFDLNKTLADMGIKEAFTNKADFSGITTKEKLYISKVIHKANISIDEQGTEAAAATAVMMRKTTALLDEISVKVDKPFIFILKNNSTQTIYFMGKVINPN